MVARASRENDCKLAGVLMPDKTEAQLCNRGLSSSSLGLAEVTLRVLEDVAVPVCAPRAPKAEDSQEND